MKTRRCGVARRCCDSVHSIMQAPRAAGSLHRQGHTSAVRVVDNSGTRSAKSSMQRPHNTSPDPAIRTLLRWRRVGSWHPGTFHRQAQSLQGGLCSARAWGIVAKIAEKPCGSGVSSFGTVFGRCCDMLHWHTVRRQAVHGQCSSGRVSIKRAVAPPKICLFSARCEAPARRLSPRCRP